ncbi:MAG: thermonuclease family protein [Alphaproteobacteria bacterium]|nr:thermonuclease family protein [Alphaproteobacteria bacterium]
MGTIRHLLSLVILCASVLGAQAAEPLAGRAQVSDGDTLRLGAARLRIHGIDAPESDQRCADASGAEWACGAWSATVLRDLVAGRDLTCAALERDRYGRWVARCTADGTDIGAAMVATGAAVAYRRYAPDYVAIETIARTERRGIWAGAFAQPEDHRAASRGVPQNVAAAPAGCAIKGNISASGRIFHSPGQLDYDRVVIDPARGERWFCSASAARAAGWRAARR